jgi:hypothetical protein
MENNINISAIELYSRKALKPFLDKYFTGDRIAGQDILTLSPIDQVNLFVVQQLFAKWQEENSKLKSPYFDFKNAHVQNALKVFMDKLSQYILASKEDLTPLILQAISNAIFYVSAPVQFLEQRYLDSEQVYTTEELKKTFKYLKWHPKLASFLKEHVEEWGDKTGKELVGLIKEEFESNYRDEEVESNLVRLMNGVLPLSISDFHYADASKKSVPPVIKKEEESDQITINDLIAKEQKPTAINMLTKNKVVDIRSAMSINQKIMFVKELFNGDNSAFEGAMSLADGSPTYEKAVNAMIDSYSQRFNWEIDSNEVNELFDLIGRKFYPENFTAQES